MIPRRLAIAACCVAVAACGDDDPCAGAPTCMRVDVDSATIDAIDQLELDVVYGDLHATTTTGGASPSSLPLATAVIFDLPGASPIRVSVVAAGMRDGTVLGTGAASTAVVPRQHAGILIALAPAEICVDGALYCGGDKLVGDDDTLYRCNSGGVPTARGRCSHGCARRIDKDDVCLGGATCQDGGNYCGGDKVDGDPQTLYVCMSGAGTAPRQCPNGCLVRPGSDDICR